MVVKNSIETVAGCDVRFSGGQFKSCPRIQIASSSSLPVEWDPKFSGAVML